MKIDMKFIDYLWNFILNRSLMDGMVFYISLRMKYFNIIIKYE